MFAYLNTNVWHVKQPGPERRTSNDKKFRRFSSKTDIHCHVLICDCVSGHLMHRGPSEFLREKQMVCGALFLDKMDILGSSHSCFVSDSILLK